MVNMQNCGTHRLSITNKKLHVIHTGRGSKLMSETFMDKVKKIREYFQIVIRKTEGES